MATPGCGVRVEPVGGDNVDTPGCGDGVISGLGAAVGEHSSFLQQESAGSATIWQFVGILGYTAHLKIDNKETVNILYKQTPLPIIVIILKQMGILSGVATLLGLVLSPFSLMLKGKILPLQFLSFKKCPQC